MKLIFEIAVGRLRFLKNISLFIEELKSNFLPTGRQQAAVCPVMVF